MSFPARCTEDWSTNKICTMSSNHGIHIPFCYQLTEIPLHPQYFPILSWIPLYVICSTMVAPSSGLPWLFSCSKKRRQGSDGRWWERRLDLVKLIWSDCISLTIKMIDCLWIAKGFPCTLEDESIIEGALQFDEFLSCSHV